MMSLYWTSYWEPWTVLGAPHICYLILMTNLFSILYSLQFKDKEIGIIYSVCQEDK